VDKLRVITDSLGPRRFHPLCLTLDHYQNVPAALLLIMGKSMGSHRSQDLPCLALNHKNSADGSPLQ